MAEEGLTGDKSTMLVRFDVPDVKAQKCVVVDRHGTVWAAKQVILEKLNQDLPRDLLNYSLYLPSAGAGKLGKYLDDGRLLMDYALQGHVPKLELKYKTRDYSVQVALSDKAIAKANTKATQRKLLEHVAAGSVKRIEKILQSGLDPNFVTDDGNTPLGLVCGRHGNIQCIMPLLSGGAHIDFRGKDGLTPLHRAAIGGNAQAIKLLLQYGASPNYRDAKGLTPVYHTAIMGDDTAACESLLRHRAELGVRDPGGWTELHQTSKYGHLLHADFFIQYGADINAQNIVGNTPLHVASSHGQTQCAMLLLKRGADKLKINFANQSPGQVAILCGHHKLAAEINGFSPVQVELIKEDPVYNPHARVYDPQLFVEKTVSETCPISPPAEALVGSLTQEWEEKEDIVELLVPPPLRKGSISGTSGHSGSIASLDSSGLADYPLTTRKGSVPSIRGRLGSAADNVETGSSSSMDQDSTHSGSKPGTPARQNSPIAQFRHGYAATFQHQRERLYRAGPGRYLALEDVEPQFPGDLPLKSGMAVEVVYIGKGGYWEGKSAGKHGWFPALAIREVTEDEPDPDTEDELDAPGTPEELDDEVEENTSSTFESIKRSTNIKDIVISRGNKGFGFAMRGVKATKAMKFHPTPQVPALQYVGNVDLGGCAEMAGLRAGDFIIEVNGHNVTYSTHDEVVNIVRKSGTVLNLRVITPLIKPKSTSMQIREHLTPTTTPERQRKSESPKPPLESTASGSLPSLQEMNEKNERTDTRGQFAYTGSPILSRIERSGWDSSQGEDSPAQFEKFGNRSPRHIPSSQPLPQRPGVRVVPITPPPAGSRYNFLDIPTKEKKSKSATLPMLPTRDYPKVSETVNLTDLSHRSLPSDEEEEDSEFAQAIKKRKEMLERQSALDVIHRSRAQTMPTPETPKALTTPSDEVDTPTPDILSAHTEMEDDILSPLEVQLRQASQNRHRRASLNQLRMTEIQKLEQVSPFSSNPIANAVMKKIDSMNVDERDGFGANDEDFSSPDNSPVRIHFRQQQQQKSRAPPPVIKPKPLRKAKTMDDIFENNTQSPPPTESEPQVTSPPWNVQLKRTPKSNRKFNEARKDLEVEQDDDGTVNWKSILKPVGTPEEMKSGSKRQTAPTEKKPMVANVFESSTKALDSKPIVGNVLEFSMKALDSEVSKEALPKPLVPQDSTEGISLHDGHTVTEMPKYYKSTSHEAFDEKYWEENVVLPPKPIDDDVNQPAVTEEFSELPPPLPPSTMYDNNLIVTDSLPNLPPPAAFVTIEGADTGETSTDDIPPPLLPPAIPEGQPPEGQPLLPPDIPEGQPPEGQPHLPPAVPEGQPPEGRPLLPPAVPEGQPPEISSTSFEEEPDIPPPLPDSSPPRLEATENLELLPDESGPGVETLAQPQTTAETSSAELTSNLVDNIPPPVDMIKSKDQVPPRPPPPQMEMEPLQNNDVSPEVITPPKEAFQQHTETKEAEQHVPRWQKIKAKEWEVSEVCEWLEDIGLGEHREQFSENEIVGEHLAELSKDDLKELGVKKLGHQKTFLSKVSQLAIL